NSALFSDGFFLYVPKECQIKTPIYLSFIATEEEFQAHPRNVFIFDENSECTLIEEYKALADQPYVMNMLTTITLNKKSKLIHYKFQQENKNALHVATTFVQQKQNSHLQHTDFSLGGIFARNDYSIDLQEKGSICNTAGFY